ncbi:MAG: pyridoxamine 5'-phosphate oxidase family protein [Pseudomonadota bacterium]
MGNNYAEIAFTDTIKALQSEMGSRSAYARREGGTEVKNGALGATEAAFISARDSFYLATVSETGWPYVQHRGGPAGFVRVLDDETLGFADFSGNRQYMSVGNLKSNNRISLFFIDYPNRTRLKLFGRAEVIAPDETQVLARLAVDGYRARVERGLRIKIAGFDWNCPQHITPRFTAAEVEEASASLHARIAELETALAQAKGNHGSQAV